MKFVFAVLIAVACDAANAETKSFAEIDAVYRKHAFASGNQDEIIPYLLRDFAEVSGQLRYCGFKTKEAELSKLAEDIAHWMNPSYWAYWNGDREEDKVRLENSAHLTFSVAVFVTKSQCERGPMYMAREAIYHRLKREIAKVLAKPL